MSQVAKILKKKHTRKGAIRRKVTEVLVHESDPATDSDTDSESGSNQKRKIFKGKSAVKAAPQAPLDDENYGDDEIDSGEEEHDVVNAVLDEREVRSSKWKGKKKKERFSFGKSQGILSSPDIDQGMSSFLKSSATIVKRDKFAAADWRDARVIDY
ncbi:hypothetical protein TrST_g10398 [Triparma strigata]|uniref:Uncharacterized protein n=1 Tax=Triparma strigata TaxID=1606541 RepID=A0A9W7C8R8_9STRA|nr:hypothetical protein TrST_g10398 [Triparma strigata]